MKTECIRLDPTRGDVTLTTYLLQDSPELLAGKKRPARAAARSEKAV